MMRRLTRVLTTSVVVSSLIFTPVIASPQDRVTALEIQKDAAEAQASIVNSQLVNLLTEYDALQKDMETQSQRIAQAETDLAAAEEKEQKQYEDMKLRIKYMYEQGDISFVEALVTAQSFAELLSKTEYVQKVHRYDRDMLEEYEATKQEVSSLKDELEAGQAEMQDMAVEMESQRSNLESTLSVMRSQIADFDSQLAQAKADVAAELARIEAEIAAAEKEEQGQSGDAGGSGTTAAAPATESGAQPAAGKEEPKQEEPKKEEPKKEEPKKEEPKKEEPKKDTSSGTSNPGNAALGQQIANKACEYIGNPYVYGGNSLTNGIDCSGFIYQIHRMFGISTPRQSSSLRSGGKAVNYADKLPGDVICYSGHVAIYIGNNTIVHASNSAPYPKGGIKTTSPANYRTVLAVRRYW